MNTCPKHLNMALMHSGYCLACGFAWEEREIIASRERYWGATAPDKAPADDDGDRGAVIIYVMLVLAFITGLALGCSI